MYVIHYIQRENYIQKGLLYYINYYIYKSANKSRIVAFTDSPVCCKYVVKTCTIAYP